MYDISSIAFFTSLSYITTNQQLQHEAQLSCELLKNTEEEAFEALFMKRIDPFLKYDVLFSVRLSEKAPVSEIKNIEDKKALCDYMNWARLILLLSSDNVDIRVSYHVSDIRETRSKVS